MKIEIIFAEFGQVNVNVAHFRTYFPDARFTLITDQLYEKKDFDQVVRVNHPFRPGDDRYGWHMNDYWQVAAMLYSDADICLAFDQDMVIVNPLIKTIIPLVKKFGLCLPANSRVTVGHDATFGIDGDIVDDESHGMAHAMNCAITALDRSNGRAVDTAYAFCDQFHHNPVRGPLAWWRAIWHTGFYPCLLPVNWCVCHKDIGCGDEILLHVGHTTVKRHYAAKGIIYDCNKG